MQNVYFTDLGICKTTSGPDPGADCVFPFKLNIMYYTGKNEVLEYTECTTDWANEDPGIPWCSTTTDQTGRDAVGQGKWGHCGSNCPGVGGIM